MSLKLGVPFNVDLLILDDRSAANLKPVTSLDTFTGLTKNFNAEGLYSNDIFGIVGTPARANRYSYIDLKIPIIHPVIYKTLVAMKSFYKDIMSSREFAKWDPELGDFIKSDVIDGETGYSFFIDNYKKLKLQGTNSITRQQIIELFEKYKDKSTLSKFLILPAGLRDIEIDDSGRASSDEINELYFKLIAISNTINPSTAKITIEAYNQQRVSMQNVASEIYEALSKVIEGKKNLMMGKWASRKIFNGTRNVITAMNTTAEELGHPKNVGFNDTFIGLYQCSKAMLPITLFELKNGFLSKVFSAPGAPALLTDPETLESKSVLLEPQTYQEWLSNESLEKFVTYFQEDSIRHEPIMVDGHYLGLIYKGPDGTFAMINGIDQLPDPQMKQYCSPITNGELLYTAIYHRANKLPVFITRYPITGIGSIYPSRVKLKTTIATEERVEIDISTGQPLGKDRVAYDFPLRNSGFYNALSPNTSRLQKLGAD